VVECVEWAPQSALPFLAPPSQGAAANGEAQAAEILVSGSRDKSIRVWDAHAGVCLFVLIGHDNWVRGLRFHPRGKFLLSVADDKTLRIWDLAQRRVFKTIDAHSHFATSVDFHPTSPYVVTSSVDMTIKVWECR